MLELRWNPILTQWTIVATHRQDRTYKPPKDYCPLCPTKRGGLPTEVPDEDFDIVVFENKFPSLQKGLSEIEEVESEFFKHGKAQGICEVVLFTSEHNVVMSREPLGRYIKLVKVWRDRYQELGQREFIDYVYIFENKGEEVGVTLEQPHGQIYAYPFIPFFARYAYEVHIYVNRHLPSFNDFCEKEEKDLAAILKDILMIYDNLFGFVFPYVMAIHQQPTDGTGRDYSHFHIEFYPPHRTKDKLKYLAGSEVGAGTFIDD